MKKIIVSVLALLCALSSCMKEEPYFKPAVEGDEVQFGVAKAKVATKTIYADEDDIAGNGDAWDLLWVEGDKVKVYCEQANRQEGNYTVHADVKALERTGDAGIQWGDTSTAHDFYAVYPNDIKQMSYDQENHLVEFAINGYQNATITAKNGTAYSTACDMTNAYMVAKHLNVDPQTTNVVGLTFDPIMTTLKITIKGPVDNGAAVFVTGVSVITKVPTTNIGTFLYDIDDMEIVPSETVLEESIFVAIKDVNNLAHDSEWKEGVTGVKLASGETLTLNAFIPPVTTGESNPVRIRVHTTGSYGSKTVTTKENITPSSKRKVTLPGLPTEVEGNNWLTPLDDQVYVNQLSIPGTHDAGTDNFVSDKGLSWLLPGLYASLGKTQEINITDQWAMGIRAFDLRPAVYHEKELLIYHGIVRTGYSMLDALTPIIAGIQKNPGEFAIITMRHESEIGDGLGGLFSEDQTKWPDLMRAMFDNINSSTYVKDGFKGTIEFKPDLTVGEMRGHILFISRDSYTGGPTGAYVNGWGGSSTTIHEQRMYGSGGQTTLLVQDYYDMTDEANTAGEAPGKVAVIKQLLGRSTQITTYEPWVLNHVSGYSLVRTIGTYEIPAIDGYRANAGYCNKLIHDYMTGDDWTPGPTGIMLMDYVGARTSNSYTVYGDILPQVIIDNNYKYRMRRKGE